MKKRQLGSTGIEIAPMIFGGNVFGWTVNARQSFELLDRFVERGLNCIDTADLYSAWVPGNQGGESETILGQWLKSRGLRDQIVLCTKVGMWDKRPGLSSGNIESAVEDSLRRLETDYIDVYFAHKDDENTPFEETMRAFDRLIQSGKVRTLGASNYGASRLLQAQQSARVSGLTPYKVIQPLYNLFDRADYEDHLAAIAREQGLGVVVYFALASGFLSGKYSHIEQIQNTARERMLGKYFTARGLRILEALNKVARSNAATPAQIALAWLLSRDTVTAPIVSATRVEQLDELIGCFDVNLSQEDVQRLNEASARD